jgi:hypothetical protein
LVWVCAGHGLEISDKKEIPAIASSKIIVEPFRDLWFFIE